MKTLLRKIARLSIVNWSMTLQYRADMMLWLFADAATPLVSMALWYAVAKNSSQGPSPQETINYYILTILVIIATNSWAGFFISQEIFNGTIVQRLIKPISAFWGLILNSLSEKTFRFLLPIPLFLASLWLFPTFFVPTLYQLEPWLIFLASLGMAATLSFFIDMIFGLLAFWIEDAFNMRWFKDTLQMITSGILIPVAVMPERIQELVNILPFRHIITTPIEVLLGRISDATLLHTLGIQLAWTVGTGIVMTMMWKQGLKRYAPPGQ